MTGLLRGVTLLVCVAAMFVGTGRAQQPRPLPEQQPFFDATRENLARAQREQYRYAYKERRSDLHVNPFGSKVGTEGVSVYDVTPGPAANVVYRRLIEKNGQPVAGSQPERQERRASRRDAKSSIDDIVEVLEFRIDRREMLDRRETIVVQFAARPAAKPETREGRLARNFKGTIWVDEAAREVMRVQAVAIDNLSYGYGVVARLNEGTSATFVRQRADADIWLPSLLRFMAEGRAMLFRKLNLDYVVEWFDYKKVL